MNLIDEAESLMLHQFQDSPRLTGLIRALVTPLEEAAQNLQRLQHGRFIEEAEGERLDILGRLMGQPRRGMSDEDYRAWIRVGIQLNRGSGTSEDVLGILRILLGPNSQNLMHEHPPNDIVFTFFLHSKVPLQPLLNIIRSAVPVGTKCHLIRADIEKIFRFDMNPFSEAQFPEFFQEDSQ